MLRVLAKPLLALTTLILVLVAAEIVFRLLDLRGFHETRTRAWWHAVASESERIPHVGFQFRPNTRFRLGYDSNPRGYFDADNGLEYRINDQGFRGPNFTAASLPESFRVLVLGDSFTFGEGVRWEDTFVVGLEERLRATGSLQAEVLNLGVSSWNTQDQALYFLHRGKLFEPDLVLVVYVLNDAYHAGGLDLWQNFRQRYEARGWMRRSYLASYAYARLMQKYYARRYIEDLVESAHSKADLWHRSFRMLSRIERQAHAQGAEFAVAIFPFLYDLDDSYPFQILHDQLISYCESEGIAVIDLLPAFLGRSYFDLWAHPSDQHPNEVAHALAADALAEFLLAQGLVPTPPKNPATPADTPDVD